MTGSATAALGADAATEQKVYSGITQPQVEALLNAQNLRFTSQGDLFVLDSGLVILPTDCENDKHVCNEIRFSRGFNNVRPPLDAVNEWNRRFKVPEASIDEEGRLHLEMWLSGVGMTDAIFLDTLTWFEKAWDTNDYWHNFTKGKAGT